MFLLNEKGFKSFVPEHLVADCLGRGFEFPEFREEVNAGSSRVLIHRNGGGLGDLIFLLPAVEDFVEAHPDYVVELAIPENYRSLFAHLPVEMKSPSDSVIRGDYKIIFDMLCPCALHEYETGYRPTKSRTENFADVFGLPPRKPELKTDPAPGRDYLNSIGVHPPFVGTAFRSAKLQKDYPREFWPYVYNGLEEMGFHVLQLDMEPRKTVHKNVHSLSDLSVEMLASILANLDLLIAPATGPLVMAGALGVPCLGLLGPTDDSATLGLFNSLQWIQGRPLVMENGESCRVPCYYSQKNGYGSQCSQSCGYCMKSIKPADVLKKVESMIQPAVRESASQRCLCGCAIRKTVGAKDGLEIYRCKSCGMVRSQRKGDYKSLYRDEYGDAYQIEKGVSPYAERFEHDREVARKRFQKLEDFGVEHS